MPKKQSTNFKQNNKSFKGHSKRKVRHQATKILKKQIAKQAPKSQQKDNTHNKEIDLTKQKQEQPKDQIKQIKVKIPKIIAFIPFNEQSSTQQIKQTIMEQLLIPNYPVTSYSTQEIFLNIPANGKLIKTPLQMIFLDRNIESIMDACKVADIICPVLSCKDCQTNQINLDPYSNANAFDAFGYQLLSNLRAQGVPPQVCLIQDLYTINNQNKRNQVKKLFNRFLESEFQNSNILESQDVNNLIRCLQSIHGADFEWRNIRGYMLPDEIVQHGDNTLTITGLWRGKLSPNQLIHLTGVDDYPITKIEIIKRDMEESLFPTNPESMDPICQGKQEITDDLLNELDNLGIAEEEQVEEEMEDQESDVSYDEESVKEEKYTMVQRAPEDLDYEDEAEYDVDVKLRERYNKYQNLTNIRTCQFDPLTFLPDEAEKIYNFRFLKKIKADVLEDMKYPIENQIVRITIPITQEIIQKLIHPNRITILSGLLKFERKLTQMHVKIHRLNDEILKSKEQIFIQVGFRRANINPIYSRVLTNCNKTKYVKQVNDHDFYLASFYFFCSFPQQPVLFWKNDFNFRSAQIMAQGEIHKCDQFQIILKRIVLTGYPIKINKRKGVIRMMFHNPEDVKYYQPVELQTKGGLKGNILEPLGTHGLMKCMFNNYIKPNDVVSLSLYKRVHPKFPK